MRIERLLRIPQQYKNLQRIREILGVIVGYGGGDLVARLELENAFQLGRTLLRSRRHRHEVVAYTTEQRIRMAFEELGPTFIKLGQILATRPDLIPMSLVHELRKLQDNVPPFSSAASRAQIESELGRPVAELFSEFETAPLAAASIAQVHRARLPGGERVAIKVRRPGLAQLVRTDLAIMRGLAELIEENVPESRQYAPVAVVEEFGRSINKEMDLSHEAFNAIKFARNFEGDPHVHVPRVHRELSTEKVLTMEYIEGVKVSDLAALDEAGLDRKEVARTGLRFCLEQVFHHGFFHADPHPGNLFVLPGNVIAPIDMGMMGVLDRETRDDLLEFLVGILMRDIDKIVKLFHRLGLIDESIDEAGLRRDGQELIERYYSVPIREVDVAVFITRLFDVLVRYRVQVPAELLLLGKALATVEGMARDLDPELDPVRAIRPFVLRFYLERLGDPRFLARDWLEVARAYADAVASFPRDAQQSLRALRRGELRIRTHAEGLEGLVREQARGQNRLAASAMIGATLLGSALLVAQEAGPPFFGLALSVWLGLAGFGLAGFGYLFVAYGFLRSGRF
jgi:ubiquinone biosynthesis protein